MTETESGAEFISEAHVRHIMRYVQARDWLTDRLYRIADAACGTGYGSKLLANAGHKVTGMDFNREALEEAQRNPHQLCQFEFYDLVGNHFKANYGAVVCIETIEHVSPEDGQRILQNFSTWLPQTGRLIISTPYCEQSGPSPITTQHLWEYSLTDFEQALAAAGFEIELMKLDRHEGKAGRLGYAMAKAIKR